MPITVSTAKKRFSRRSHRLQRRTAGGFSRRHDGTFDNGCIADDHSGLLLRRKHFDCHLTVRLRPAQVHQDGNALIRPGGVDGSQDFVDIGSQPPFRIAAAI